MEWIHPNMQVLPVNPSFVWNKVNLKFVVKTEIIFH